MGRPRVGVESGGEPELKIEIRADAAADAPIGASQCITTRTGDFTPTFATASCGATCTQQFVGPAGETQSCPSPMHEDIGALADVATPGTHVATADVTTATMIHSACRADPHYEYSRPSIAVLSTGCKPCRSRGLRLHRQIRQTDLPRAEMCRREMRRRTTRARCYGVRTATTPADRNRDTERPESAPAWPE